MIDGKPSMENPYIRESKKNPKKPIENASLQKAISEINK